MTIDQVLPPDSQELLPRNSCALYPPASSFCWQTGCRGPHLAPARWAGTAPESRRCGKVWQRGSGRVSSRAGGTPVWASVKTFGGGRTAQQASSPWQLTPDEVNCHAAALQLRHQLPSPLQRRAAVGAGRAAATVLQVRGAAQLNQGPPAALLPLFPQHAVWACGLPTHASIVWEALRTSPLRPTPPHPPHPPTHPPTHTTHKRPHRCEAAAGRVRLQEGLDIGGGAIDDLTGGGVGRAGQGRWGEGCACRKAWMAAGGAVDDLTSASTMCLRVKCQHPPSHPPNSPLEVTTSHLQPQLQLPPTHPTPTYLQSPLQRLLQRHRSIHGLWEAGGCWGV